MRVEVVEKVKRQEKLLKNEEECWRKERKKKKEYNS